MKIKNLTFKNHKILSDLSIDFTDEAGEPLDVVVFIGDNGTGKTKVLETIVKMIEDDWARHTSRYFEYQQVSKSEKDGARISNYSQSGFKLISYVEEDGHTTITESYEDSEYIPEQATSLMIEGFSLPMIYEAYRREPDDLKPKVIWMPADLNIKDFESLSEYQMTELFEQEKKKSIVIHANEWLLDDVNDYIVKKISGALSYAIATNDTKSAKVINDQECKHINDTFDILELNVKLVGLSADDQTPAFENKEGKRVKLKHLSAGEKQLFFRLLSLKSLNINRAIIIVDEPETSLHPEWQRKIIKAYEDIGENNQIIMATHSPLILGSVPSTSVRIMSRNEEGKIEVHLSDQTYGKSVEEILSGVMDLNSLRDEATAKNIADVTKLLEDDKYDTEEYKSLMADLKKQLGATDKDIMLIEMEKAIRMRQHATSK